MKRRSKRAQLHGVKELRKKELIVRLVRCDDYIKYNRTPSITTNAVHPSVLEVTSIIAKSEVTNVEFEKDFVDNPISPVGVSPIIEKSEVTTEDPDERLIESFSIFDSNSGKKSILVFNTKIFEKLINLTKYLNN